MIGLANFDSILYFAACLVDIRVNRTNASRTNFFRVLRALWVFQVFRFFWFYKNDIIFVLFLASYLILEPSELLLCHYLHEDMVKKKERERAECRYSRRAVVLLGTNEKAKEVVGLLYMQLPLFK